MTDHFDDPTTGRQYLVMDYVEGEDLEAMVARQGALSEELAVEWMQQVLGAVAYLHGQQPPVIHRDIKPSNIKITPQGKAVLVDFGIAKVFEGGGGTLTGARAATPGYAPPEQYGLRTDQRSDVYAAGATLYTLLTGVVPPEATLRVANLAYLAPVRQVKPRVSGSVERAVEGALQVDTSKRWQSAAALSAALAAPAAAAQPAMATVQVTPGQAATQMAAPVYSAAPAPAVQVPAVPASPSRKSNTMVWAIVGGIIGLVALVGIVLYATGTLNKMFAPQPIIQVVVVPTKTPVPSPTLDINATGTAMVSGMSATLVAQELSFNATRTASAPTATPIPTETPTRVPATASPVPATATPPPTAKPVTPTAAATATPAPPRATATPAAPPGIYVTNIRLDPAKPNRGNQVTFYVTFLNTTGAPSNYAWQILLYEEEKCCNPARTYGTSLLQQMTIPTGSNVLASANNWKVAGAGDCVSFYAQVSYQDPEKHPVIFNMPNGQPYTIPFTVCPAL